jgi:hypothetical protein
MPSRACSINRRVTGVKKLDRVRCIVNAPAKPPNDKIAPGFCECSGPGTLVRVFVRRLRALISRLLLRRESCCPHPVHANRAEVEPFFLTGVQPSLFDRGGCRRRASSSLVLSGKGELCSWLEPEWLVCRVQTKTRPTADVPEGVEGPTREAMQNSISTSVMKLSLDNGSQLPWFPRGDPTCCSGRMQKLCCA